VFPGSLIIRSTEQPRFSSILAMTPTSFKEVLLFYRHGLEANGFAVLNDEVDPADGELLMLKGTLRVAVQVKATSCPQETSAYAISYTPPAKG
jgi:hypothetical protein